ncbi:hypothetical protein BAUCODRAFT_31574 [Baudoinia panamericana UAMH 10762]|uniref:Uncharacterized protein n=1 Tax=Baudoinia panamericana (strain UAMH 10762) TaxID=717646 RepID=M2LX19_BAUPA|nr:uncharacterized protein BAUCODRAFT_31574 [Baudoinia panamericana UAMH 10762]EMC99232.1 hypothetical protein BAUCODRAFT_31574 [Baudoinia panamericana UAMH 10762]
MASNGWQNNATFDPYAQTFVLLQPDGLTPFPALLGDVLALNTVSVTQGIIYGTQVGISGLLLLILLIMTKPDKRRSLVFILNSLSLLLIFARNVLSCVQLTTIFYNFYNWELHWYPESPALSRAMDLSAATEVLNIPIDVAIFSSLVVQVHIVCCTIHTLVRTSALLSSAAVGLAAVAVRFALAVVNIKYSIFGINTLTEPQFNLIVHLKRVSDILTVVAIAFFSSIFVAKLGVAIHTRRTLNLKNFGAIQIIFIMGCQTMLIPCKCTLIIRQPSSHR